MGGGPYPHPPILGGPKIDISAELSFLKSKLTLTVRKVLKNIRQLSRCQPASVVAQISVVNDK